MVVCLWRNVHLGVGCRLYVGHQVQAADYSTCQWPSNSMFHTMMVTPLYYSSGARTTPVKHACMRAGGGFLRREAFVVAFNLYCMMQTVETDHMPARSTLQ